MPLKTYSLTPAEVTVAIDDAAYVVAAKDDRLNLALFSGAMPAMSIVELTLMNSYGG